MKAIVHVSLKPGVLDPQGKAVADTLGRLGYDEVRDARMAKTIELDLEGDLNHDQAKARVAEMCEALLANTVIERYAIELED
ncbi:MAG: phosphoribosylformylglycinamidine synthase subunit PurS [Pseudomonadota bacterium]